MVGPIDVNQKEVYRLDTGYKIGIDPKIDEMFYKNNTWKLYIGYKM